VNYCRERRGPALIHASVTRPYSHSLSDDEKLYKVPEEREAEAHRDPLSKFALFLVREGLLDQKQIEALEAQVDHEVRQARTRRWPRSRQRSSPFCRMCIRRMWIRPAPHLMCSRNCTARQRPWWKW